MTDQPNLLHQLEFRSIGPTRGGRVVAVAGDPLNSATFYFGSTGGGVWKSDDGGQFWTNVSDGFFKRASVGGLAVAASDRNVIYAGMGESTIRGNVSHGDGVYKSTDAGQTWTHMGLEQTRNIGKVRVDPRDPDTVFVAAFGHAHGPNPERGLYRSKDGGRTWDLVLYRSEKAGANDLTINPSNPREIYVGFWEAERGPHFMSSGGPGSSLYKSTDGGDTWTELSDKPGMPKGLKGKIGVVVAPSRPGRVYAMLEHDEGGVFRSDDGGEHWERVSDDRNLRQRAWYYSHIVADPQDADTVWVANVELWRSIDGGKTFAQVPAPHGDNHDLWIDPHNTQRMILGNDGGGTVSFNGGRSWSTLYNQPTGEFYHVIADSRTPYRVYGAQQDNTTMSVPSRSNHDAITFTEWYEIGGGESGYIAIRPDNPDIVYAGSYQGYLTRYDHGLGQLRNITVWPEVYLGQPASDFKYRFQWTSPTILSPHDPNILMTGANHVFRSSNEGQSWDIISPDLTRGDPETLGPSGGPITKDNTGAEVYGTVFSIAESPLTAGVIWSGSDDGLVYITRDGGANWENATPDTLPDWALISLIDASPHHEGTAYLAATRYKLDDFAPYIYKTRDYGKTWTKITSGIPTDDFTRVVREDPKQQGLLYAGTETGLYVSYDDGGAWQRLGGNFPVVPVHDLVIKGDELVVGTHGRSFWILDDLSVIRQLAQDSTAATRLLAPKETVRWGAMHGFGHSPVPGRNYAFASGMIPAYQVTKTPDGETKATFIDAGNNPPAGVLIHYTLTEKPKEPLTLTILDEAGQEIRSYSSKKEKDESGASLTPKGPDVPPAVREAEEVEDKAPKLPTQLGLNRFVWDLRHADADKITSKGGDQAGTTGPTAKPGNYQARLKVGEQEFSASFTVVPDPRLGTSAADYAAQEELGLKIRDKHSELNRAVNTIRAAREQSEGWAKRAKDNAALGEAAKVLKGKLDAIEAELLQVKAQSMQDTLNYPVKLNTKLAALSGTIASAEAAPTRQAYELFDNLVERIDAQLAELAKLLKRDVPAFNKVVQDAAVPAVVVG